MVGLSISLDKVPARVEDDQVDKKRCTIAPEVRQTWGKFLRGFSNPDFYSMLDLLFAEKDKTPHTNNGINSEQDMDRKRQAHDAECRIAKSVLTSFRSDNSFDGSFLAHRLNEFRDRVKAHFDGQQEEQEKPTL